MQSKERAKLRSLAQTLPNLVSVGKEGLTQNVISSCEDAFNTHELIKINVLNTAAEDVKTLAYALAEGTKSEVVETKGRTIVLYKFNKKLKLKIEL